MKASCCGCRSSCSTKTVASGHINLYPWFVSVPHEDVNSETNSWEVRDSEKLKLDESYKRISAVLDRVEKRCSNGPNKAWCWARCRSQLFVTGHTDTVGGDNDNVVLSRNRAKAIATYFRQKGFRMPIYFVGYGERTPPWFTPATTSTKSATAAPTTK